MKNRMIVGMMVGIALACSVPVLALDVSSLSRAVAEFAAANEWVKPRIQKEVSRTRPSPKLLEKLAEMSEAQKTIEREIQRITTRQELQKALQVAAIYRHGPDSERFASNHLILMLKKHREALSEKSPEIPQAEERP